MAKTGATTISLSVSGDGIGQDTWSNTNTNVAAPGGGPFPVALTAGDNVLTPPTGSQYFTLIPSSTSTNAKKISNLASATNALKINPALPICIPVTAALDTICVNVAANETVLIMWT